MKLSNKTFICLIINYDKEIVMGQGGLTTLTTAPFWTQVEREIAEYDPIMKKKRNFVEEVMIWTFISALE